MALLTSVLLVSVSLQADGTNYPGKICRGGCGATGICTEGCLCAAGYGGDRCDPCEEGTFQPEHHKSTADCLPHRECVWMSGKEVYIAKLGTLLSDVHCGACDHVTCIENQYRTGLCSGPTNGYNCNNCSNTECGANEYRTGSCAGTVNGFQCISQPTCGAGEYISPDSSTGRRTCHPCADNEYQKQESHRETSCTAQPVCGPGERATADSMVLERKCEPCDANTYADFGDAHRETACLSQPTCDAGFSMSPESNEVRRVCEPCKENTYMSQSGHRLTECIQQPACTNGQYIAPAADSAVVARVCMPCGANTYMDQAAHQDPACKTQPMCGAGLRASVDTFDAVRTCSGCGAGTFQPHSNHRETDCYPVTVCPDSTTLLVAPTATSDRVCTGTVDANDTCSVEYFKVGPNEDVEDDESCRSLTSCDEPGRFISTLQTLTTDLTCGLCNGADTFQKAPGSGTCTAMGWCAAGYYAKVSGSSTQDVECAPCPEGQYQPADNHREPKCLLQHSCGPGMFLSGSDDATRRGTCQPCAEGSYQSEANHLNGACTAQTSCGLGEYISPNSYTEERKCHPCPAGTYQNKRMGHRDTQCLPRVMCKRGQLVSTLNASLSSLCEPCPTGTYQTSDEHLSTECNPQPTCSYGQRADTSSSLDEVRACIACGAGKYRSERTHEEVTCNNQRECNVGEYITADSRITNRECVQCQDGYYQDTEKHNTVEACLPQPVCGKGRRVVAHTDTVTQKLQCEDCPENEYQPDPDGRAKVCYEQLFCGLGTKMTGDKSTNDAKRECLPCSAGQYMDARSHRNTTCAEQVTCGAGEFLSYSNNGDGKDAKGNCLACPNGEYQPSSSHRKTNCIAHTSCLTDRAYKLTGESKINDGVCVRLTFKVNNYTRLPQGNNKITDVSEEYATYIGDTYSFAPIRLTNQNVENFTGLPVEGNVRYSLGKPRPPGFLVDTETGEIQGIPEDFTVTYPAEVEALELLCQAAAAAKAETPVLEGSGDDGSGDGSRDDGPNHVMRGESGPLGKLECDPMFNKVRASFQLTLIAMDKGSNEAVVETVNVLVQQRGDFKVAFGKWDERTLTSVSGYRPKYAMGKTYQLNGPRLPAKEMFEKNFQPLQDSDSVSYEMSVESTDGNSTKQPGQWFVNEEGESIVTMSREGSFTGSLTAVDATTKEKVVIKVWEFEVLYQDIEVAEYGPNNKTCNSGTPSDPYPGDEAESHAVIFDGSYTCSCPNTHIGKNCETEDNSAAIASQTIAAGTGGGVGFIIVVVLIFILVGKYRAYQISMKQFDFEAEISRLLKNGELDDDQAETTQTPREIGRRFVTITQKLGSGAFGDVCQAILDADQSRGVPAYPVAVKTVRDGFGEAASELFREAAVMQQVAGPGTGHPNLVSIIGVVTKGTPLLLILSLCDRGSILDVVKAEGGLSWEKKVWLMLGSALGMAHLAEKSFVHRDLAARNVLVDSAMTAKVADFGLSRGIHESEKSEDDDGDDDANDGKDMYYRSQRGVFPVRWSAPESMEALRFTTASDVWSYGVLLFEILSDGMKPYPELRTNDIVISSVSRGYRMAQHPSCDQHFYSMMIETWTADPKGRPTFGQIADYMSARHAAAVEAGGVNSGYFGGDDAISQRIIDRNRGTGSINHKRTTLYAGGVGGVGAGGKFATLRSMMDVAEGGEDYLMPTSSKRRSKGSADSTGTSSARGSSDYLRPTLQAGRISGSSSENAYLMPTATPNVDYDVAEGGGAADYDFGAAVSGEVTKTNYDVASASPAVKQRKSSFQISADEMNLFDTAEPTPKKPFSTMAGLRKSLKKVRQSVKQAFAPTRHAAREDKAVPGFENQQAMGMAAMMSGSHGDDVYGTLPTDRKMLDLGNELDSIARQVGSPTKERRVSQVSAL